jgi:hypothetical protein
MADPAFQFEAKHQQPRAQAEVTHIRSPEQAAALEKDLELGGPLHRVVLVG